MKNFAGGIFALLAALMALKLAPHYRSLYTIVTYPMGFVPLKTDCGDSLLGSAGRTPQLRLSAIAECASAPSIPLPNEITKPCVVRGGISEASIQSFLEDIDTQPFMLEIKPNNYTGNPVNIRGWKRDEDKSNGVVCTTGELMNEDPRCAGTYNSFRSLNYSYFAALDNSFNGGFHLEDHDRVDILVGNLFRTMATAPLHSNNFEESTTLQLVGTKMWLMPSPQDMYGHFGAYCLGPYNAVWNVCPNQLDQVEFQTVLTNPGDAVVFPKAYPHMIYTSSGPNFMINFRREQFTPFSVFRDAIAGVSNLSKIPWLWGNLMAKYWAGVEINNEHRFIASKNFCKESGVAQEVSSFGHGHPRQDSSPFSFHEKTKDIDFRCHFNNVQDIKQFHAAVDAQSHLDEDLDMAILSQVAEFNADLKRQS